MQKLPQKTPNKTQEHIAKIAELFPHVISEGKVDFGLLRQVLSEELVEGSDERYQLDWVGKRASLLKANRSIDKTLRPCVDESVDFDTTENLYIEGDNFEVLKLIGESYLSKIKMIYIDPPYNTGKDFVYRDNFTTSQAKYEEELGLRDEEENKLFKNTDSNGRFHSDWLSMMYERLLLSRDLLRDDGVIFISIDDNEVHNLRKICDEVFGEGNFYCVFIWQKRSGSMDSVDGTSTDHEYVLCYGKTSGKLVGVERKYEKYTNPDNDPRGPWISDNLSAGKAGGDVHYKITDPKTGNTFLPPKGRYWPYSPKTMQQKIKENRIIFPKESTGRPMLKRFQYEAKSNYLPVSSILRNYTEKKLPNNTLVSALNTKGTSELQELFDNKIFSFPKSTILLKSLMTQALNNENDIILDFFSGSSTTAHAVMQLNAEDQGNRKFIMVQLPEPTDEKSEAYKAGYHTIAEIGKERIRRAGKQINEKLKTNSEKLVDVGFRVLKVDSSNMKDIYYHPSKLRQNALLDLESNIKEDRTPVDLLFATMLDLGIELSLQITPHTVDGATLYAIENNELVACFDEHISLEAIKAIKALSPYQVVLKDSSFANDSDKINAVESLSKVATVSVI